MHELTSQIGEILISTELFIIQEELERSLPGFIAAQRWYSAKALGERKLVALSIKELGLFSITTILTIWRSTGPSDSFFLFIPVVLLGGETWRESVTIAVLSSGERLVDALTYQPFVEAWTKLLFTDSQTLGVVRGIKGGTPSGSNHVGPINWKADPISAQQSNSSVRIGNWGILKFYRKFAAGTQPEVEIGQFLAEFSGNLSVPRLLGWHEVVLDKNAQPPAVVSVLHEFIESDGDGWDWVLSHLLSSCPYRAMAWFEVLGRETAALHKAFAIDARNPAFSPEPVTIVDREAWVQSAVELAKGAFQLLKDQGAATSRHEVERLADHMPNLQRRLEALLSFDIRIDKMRYHGDLVLGQVLVKGGGAGAVFTDFEGEPLRSMAERFAKHSPLRDVAGILRSFSYAEAVARLSGIMPPLKWVSDASSVFIKSYLHRIGSDPSWPSDRSIFDQIIKFFMIEKAFYEIVYELSYRPNWQHIPIKGVLCLLD